ncbi:hypothetical protein ACH3VR_07060 [Microbacterium sp. B2969]|uniref:Uncharacterized protein n=1 Tax=Microbacterium alkaliflavum TaxID=3248839 RepID=A0ABW7Q5H9_9MICO
MSDPMSPREHDDMRDLLIAGTQRIRPAVSRRAWVSVGIAAILVGATVGGVATAALNTPRHGTPPASPAPSSTPTSTPIPTRTSDEVIPFDPNALEPTLPDLAAPAEGTHVTPPPDPPQDARVMLGTRSWLDEQGIDFMSAQGFQRVAGIQAWTAPLTDGTGWCILIRKDFSGGGFSEVACDADGAPARVEREVDGALLRFTIVGDAIDVYNVPR